MWPFSDMSLAVATRIGNIANAILLLSLIFGVVSTFFIVQTANVKEELWDKEREASREKVAVLDNETARLSAQASDAQAKIAEANAKASLANEAAATANLEIARLTGRRSISDEQRTIVSLSLKPYIASKIKIGFPFFGDGEIMQFTQEIANLLGSIGFDLKDSDVSRMLNYQETGLKVVAHHDSFSERLAVAVQEAFSKAGLVMRLERDNVEGDQSAVLYVGARF